MGVTVAVARAAVNTDTGTQDFTSSDMGDLTPSAALFIVTACLTDGTPANNRVIGIGSTTGSSNRWAVNSSDEHNQATTDTYQRWVNDKCIQIINPADGSIDGDADFDSFITNGVRINWGNAPGSAYLMTVVLFGGTDLSVHAGSFDVQNVVDTTTDITDPGFEPDLLIVAANTGQPNPDTIQSQSELSLGVVHNDGVGGITQRGLWINSRDNQATGEVASILIDDGAIAERAPSDGDPDWYGEFGVFDANGFSCTTRDAGGNNRDIHYLALNFNGVVDSWVGNYTTPTSAGNDGETGPGFTPQFVYLLGTHAEAIDTAYVDANAGTLSVSVIDEDDAFCNSVSSEDAAATTNTQSLSDDTAIECPDDDGTAGITASFVSFDANGWTLNYSAVTTNAKIFLALAIEAEAGAGVTIPVIMHHRQQQKAN